MAFVHLLCCVSTKKFCVPLSLSFGALSACFALFSVSGLFFASAFLPVVFLCGFSPEAAGISSAFEELFWALCSRLMCTPNHLAASHSLLQ